MLLGELFDAWMNRRLSVHDRVVVVVHAHMVLHNWWFPHPPLYPKHFLTLYSITPLIHISRKFYQHVPIRLCDSLIAHVLALTCKVLSRPSLLPLAGGPQGFLEHFFDLLVNYFPVFFICRTAEND